METITTKECANRLNLSEQLVIYYAKTGKLDCIHSSSNYGTRREILLNEKFRKLLADNNKPKRIKTIKVKDGDAWLYRADALGKECSASLNRELKPRHKVIRG